MAKAVSSGHIKSATAQVKGTIIEGNTKKMEISRAGEIGISVKAFESRLMATQIVKSL